MGFDARSFGEILEGVRSTMHWYQRLRIKTSGTRLERIESQIAEIMAGLAGKDREDFFRNRSRPMDYWALVDGASFVKIWEQFNKLPSNAVPRSLLRDAIQGELLEPTAEQPGTGSENPRNFQTQLEVAASFSAAGFSVNHFDDVGFEFQGRTFLVECKRVSSASQLSYNVKRANVQIAKRLDENGRALIAIAPEKLLGLDERAPPILRGGAGELNEIITGMVHEFFRAYGLDFPADLDSRILAILLVIRFVCHDLTHGGYSAVNYRTLTPRFRDHSLNAKLFRELGQSMEARSK